MRCVAMETKANNRRKRGGGGRGGGRVETKMSTREKQGKVRITLIPPYPPFLLISNV